MNQPTSVIDGALPFGEKTVDILTETAELVSVRVILGHSWRRQRFLARRSARRESRRHVLGGRDHRL